MSYAVTHTRSAVGIHAHPVTVEVHLSNGLPSFAIVGLPEAAVKESKDRVRSAILNSQFEFPICRITINLAPADLPKSGSGFDLAIALGILAASKQIALDKLKTHEFVAELALDGQVRGVNGIIPISLATNQDQRTLIISTDNAAEAALTELQEIFTAQSLREVCHYLCQNGELASLPETSNLSRQDDEMDWSDVKGQIHAKAALEVAACGGHSVLLSGVPGSGKSMLAKRFMTLLPELNQSQALECAAIHSVTRTSDSRKYWRQPPFRSPHHTASPIALVGGGNPPKPGEISLAHHGVLFLDELPEFHRHVLETLREPIESGSICISRAAMQMEYPAKFQLIAAMNPCPCGHFGNPKIRCVCSPDRINRYIAKISGPLLERIDMHVFVHSISTEELLTPTPKASKDSPRLRDFVREIRTRQRKRQGCLNAELSVKATEEYAKIDLQQKEFIATALAKLGLSARAYHRWLKVALTIADMKDAKGVELSHLQQALSFKHTMKTTHEVF